MPSWLQWNFLPLVIILALVFTAILLVVSWADIKVILKNNGTVFWFNDASTQVVRSAIEKLIVVVVYIEDEWWVRFKVVLVIDFIV